MEAEFLGSCDYCGEDIEPGQEIKRRKAWGWVHDDCSKAIDEEAKDK